MTLILKDEHLPVPPVIAISRRFIVLGVCTALLFGAVVGTGLTFYRWHAHHGVARTIARWLPLPVGHVEGRVLWYRQLSEQANALEALAEVPANESIGLALLRAQREVVVERLAGDLGVAVSDEEIDVFVAEDTDLRLLKEKALWTERDYHAAVTSYLLAEKVETALLTSSSHQAYARGRMEKVLTKLAEGVPFADVALHYSEGNSSTTNGDLGYVDVTTLPSSLAEAVRTLPLNEVSPILETDRAFLLATVLDRLPEDANGITMARVRVVEIKKDLLGEIVTRALATTNVAIWIY